MKKQLLTLTIAALLTTGQSAMAFQQVNSENDYEPALSNGWIDQASENNQAIKVSYRQSDDAQSTFNGGSENDTSVITFTFPAGAELTKNPNSLSVDYVGNR